MKQDISKNSFLSRGCSKKPDPEASENKIYTYRCSKFPDYDWLKNIKSPDQKTFEFVEVRFKNSKKEIFKYYPEMDLSVGDIVAVESSPGHDIGIISLTGEIVRLQMKRKNFNTKSEEIKKVYRRARVADIEKWILSVEDEDNIMFQSRKITGDLNLDMKINDVEYQGDGTKAIFYYTASERVDFRELIKILAETFKIRIEMRQIGVRQEASRLGGIGSCGRELCCSTWLSNFKSVSTNSARTQQLSLNPQKLAGQCGKLKCCINFEQDYYAELIKEFPEENIVIDTKKGKAKLRKIDALKKILWFSYFDEESKMHAISLNNFQMIIKLNKNNKKPESLESFVKQAEKKTDFEGSIGQDDINRFNKKK
ncbi:MAG: hypothetical protein K9J13_15970 [Saprospiraceae bacterium]|nr:hypothetical protein [Saprospiraceae bacterium]